VPNVKTQREPARRPPEAGSRKRNASKSLGKAGRSAALHEDRVGRADLCADARYEGQVDSVEIVWAPAEKEGV
jgi:hypothetical protein